MDVVEKRNLQSGQDVNLMKLPDYLLESQSIEILSFWPLPAFTGERKKG